MPVCVQRCEEITPAGIWGCSRSLQITLQGSEAPCRLQQPAAVSWQGTTTGWRHSACAALLPCRRLSHKLPRTGKSLSKYRFKHLKKNGFLDCECRHSLFIIISVEKSANVHQTKTHLCRNGMFGGTFYLQGQLFPLQQLLPWRLFLCDVWRRGRVWPANTIQHSNTCTR